MKTIIFVAGAAVSLMSAPLHAQMSENASASVDQNQTPGLQQTPDGRTMKMAVEKDKSVKESQAAPTGGERPTASTGPTFPSDRPAK